MHKPLVKIARTAMKGTTIKLLRDQGGLCLLCRDPIDIQIPKEGVVDHDHKTGEVRGILHRWCNSQLGKVENAAIRAKRGLTYEEWLANAVQYIQEAKTGLMYPTHKTEDEKRAAKNLAERKRRAQIKVREAMAKRGTGD